MRIDKLYIKDFKNLKDFHVNFDEHKMINVIVGQNGTGKSNVMEALVIIFRDLDLGADPAFTYEIEYDIYNYRVKISADPARFKGERKTKDFYHISVTSHQT